MKLEFYKPTKDEWEFIFLPMILLCQFEGEHYFAVGWLCWAIALKW